MERTQNNSNVDKSVKVSRFIACLCILGAGAVETHSNNMQKEYEGVGEKIVE